MSFVRLENLNDFIQPGATCVKPIEKKTPGLVAKVSDINLSDCLACSGCITSAETVLVQQQNYEELFKVINDNKTSKTNKEIIVSMSLQSIASLANIYSMTAQETAERLASFFVSLGCNKVYDINLARHLALLESYRELKQRRSDGSKLPIISSICPGWICYAEKTNGDLVIPYLSKVRSPQQIFGSILKQIYSQRHAKTDCDIYHVTLMPCFDKKLEASRSDFKSSNGSQDVDCVLTSIELDEIFVNEGVKLNEFNRRPLDCLQETGLEFDSPLTSHIGSTSGGYAENLLLAEAADSLGLKDLEPTEIEYSTTNNSDFIEVNIRKEYNAAGGDKKSLARFAIVNGFRNIQTVVQRLKRRALKYDYIEIMACPSGCINGGAQCRPRDGEDQAMVLEGAKDIYKSVKSIKLDLSNENKLNTDLYYKLGLDEPVKINDTLYTSFHSIPKIQNLSVNW